MLFRSAFDTAKDLAVLIFWVDRRPQQQPPNNFSPIINLVKRAAPQIGDNRQREEYEEEDPLEVEGAPSRFVGLVVGRLVVLFEDDFFDGIERAQDVLMSLLTEIPLDVLNSAKIQHTSSPRFFLPKSPIKHWSALPDAYPFSPCSPAFSSFPSLDSQISPGRRRC